MSNDIMTKRKRKTSKKSAQGTVKARSSAKEPVIAYRSLTVTRGGRQKRYDLRTGYGYFIPAVKKAENLAQISELVEEGLPYKQMARLVEYLDMTVPDIAKAASVSASTVSRWTADTPIGAPGSSQFFRIDEVIRKGVEVFGGLDELKVWLKSPNQALGNQTPSKLLLSQIGLELVDEALDALHYGNVM